MTQPNWKLEPLSSEEFGPSPLEGLLNLWVKLQAINLGHIEKPKFYYITTEHLDSPLNVYTVSTLEGIKVSIFHPRMKEAILSEALKNGWQPVDYQEYSKTEEWLEKFGNKSFDKLTQDLITRMSKNDSS